MRSHFIPQSVETTSRMAMACALTGATAMMAGVCSAQVALDRATDPTYASGWSAGQNGGFGFGAWSFTGTSDGGGQVMSSASAIGAAWTLFNANTGTGISDAGRSIAGGLQIGQTFETVIQNPVSYHYFGGFDILFKNGTDNDGPGVNTSSIRAQVFDSAYYNPGSHWSIQDNGGGNNTSSLTGPNTGVAGMKLDLTLNSATAYTLTMLSLNGGSYTLNGTYSGPINYVNFRLYNSVASSGPNDVANNFGVSYMEIFVPEPSTLALLGLGAGLVFLRRRT